jgi:large repetitive protein
MTCSRNTGRTILYKGSIVNYKKMIFIITIALPMLFVTAFTASAETEITSNITINTTWDLAGSPYILTGDIDVSADADPVLTVEAGVEVRFNSNASLRIGNNTYSENMGGLMVQGTEADPVLFTSNAATPAPGD